jgi:F-type H+-transporting ATPase subunit delta
MAELTTLARPYAQAVFEMARAKGNYAEWSQNLTDLIAIASNPDVAAASSSTKVSKSVLTEIFIAIGGDAMSAETRNLVALLIENGRLILLPEIAAVYELLRAEAESTIEAEVVSAFPMDKAQEDKIAAALKARLGRDVSISTTIDKNIVGGVIIRAGDLVIDGSVSGRLSKLDHAMNL